MKEILHWPGILGNLLVGSLRDKFKFLALLDCATCLKMAYNSKMFAHRAKLSEIWDSGVVCLL